MGFASEPIREYLRAYERYMKSRTDASYDRLGAEVEAVTAWLWEAGIGRLLEELRPAERVVLVPGGLLSFLPLHAAWTPDAARPTGRRHLGDDIMVGIAPSARAIRESLARPMAAAAAGAVVVTAAPGEAPPAAIAEAQLVAAALGTTPLSGLTPEAVMGALVDAGIAHFATHGNADMNDPLASAVELGSGRQLTAGDLLGGQVGVGLAVLSACETGVPGVHVIDELVGLPTAFLQAGAKGVVASLWPVPDTPTLELVFALYRQLRGQPATHAGVALREAQRFVRDTPRDEKLEVYDNPEDWVPAEVSRTLRRSAALSGPTDLRDWAAFTYIGA